MTLKRSPMKRLTPLKASRGLQRRTPLQPKTDLRATKPLERSSVPLKRAPLVAKRVKPKLTAAQKKPLVQRSGGVCEIQTGLCTFFAVDPCHRINEGMGGRHGVAAEENDRLSVVLHGCRACHEWTHQHPRSAELNGWRLRSGTNPRQARVRYRGHWSLLSDDGRVTPV